MFACTFDECYATSCNWNSAPYTCLRWNGGPMGGCSTTPWEAGTCDVECDLSNCASLPIPADTPNCNDTPCPASWCSD